MPVINKTLFTNGSYTAFQREWNGTKYVETKTTNQSNYPSGTYYKNSVSSPIYWTKSKVMIAYKPRSGRTPTLPDFPRRRYIKRPFLKPRRLKQSTRSWKRSLAIFESRLKRYELKLNEIEVNFQKRLLKYNVRMAKYQAFLNKKKNGIPKKVRIKSLGTPLQWNPYSETTIFDTGTIGSITTYGRHWQYGKEYRNFYSKSGDITAAVDTVKYGGWPTVDFNEVQTKALAGANSVALNRFHEKLTGEQVHLGQIIAERAQAYGLLADSATRLVNFLRNFTPRGAIKSLGKAITKRDVRNAAGDYLAFKFGAEPLMSDVKGAAEAVAHLMVDKLDTFTVKVVGSGNKEESSTIVLANGDVATIRIKVNVRYVCEYRLDNVLVREMSALGLINPAEILWEVVPWSFVVDWVLPIGNFIRHISNEAGLKFHQGTKSTRIVKTVTVKSSRAGADPSTPQRNWFYEEWRHNNWSRTRGEVSKVRTVLSASPRVELPRFKNPFSATHVLEGIALLLQRKFK